LDFFLQVLLPKTVLVSSLLPSWPRALTISVVSSLIYFLSLLVSGLLLFFHYGCGLVLFSLLPYSKLGSITVRYTYNLVLVFISFYQR
jgi:hypothetical protein